MRVLGFILPTRLGLSRLGWIAGLGIDECGCPLLQRNFGWIIGPFLF